MEYISSFTYCDSIQTEMAPHGPRSQIVNPLQVLVPIAVPSNYSFAISCNIAGFDNTQENIVRIQFVSPEEDILYDTGDIKFLLPKEQQNAEKPSLMQFNLDLRNIILRKIGIYSTKVWFNQKLLGEYKIQVMVGE